MIRIEKEKLIIEFETLDPQTILQEPAQRYTDLHTGNSRKRLGRKRYELARLPITPPFHNGLCIPLGTLSSPLFGSSFSPCKNDVKS